MELDGRVGDKLVPAETGQSRFNIVAADVIHQSDGRVLLQLNDAFLPVGCLFWRLGFEFDSVLLTAVSLRKKSGQGQ